MLAGEHLAGAAGAGDDFVRDHQDVVPVADLTNARPIFPGRGNYATGAHHRFGDEERDSVGPIFENRFFQFVGAGHRAGWILFAQRASVAVRRSDMPHIGQHRFEEFVKVIDAGEAGGAA